ncbi:hypothetical protein [Dyella sp.]|uniref:hypothetical protein n=1 Tax=Dyella sp. TaxID=1869338 RepID=UPI002ED2A2DC
MHRLAVATAACLPWLAVAQELPRTPAEYLRMMDSNGDGRVSEAEYVQYMSAGFYRLDVNGDGVLEPEELPGGHGHRVTLKAFQDNLRRQFRKLDSHRDGYLDARELAAPPSA